MPNPPRTPEADADVLRDEIRWLASFGFNPHAIARQLHVSVSTVEKHLAGRRT